ncbi:MAG: NOL1/NOP2/sun family putative RNA methylase [Candidatus Nanoarchaeia archaeon]
MSKVIIPKAFREKYNKIAPRPKEFFRILEEPLEPSFRICTNKISRNFLIERLRAQGWEIEAVPFYKDGFVLKSELRPGLSVEHFMGYIYMQEVVSMIPPVVLEPKPGELILDMCAAPGSKTTQISQMMQNKPLILANDVDWRRLKPLKHNLEKCGCLNVAISLMDGRAISKKQKFDKILLDVPCSSEGQIRKDWSVLSRWSFDYVKKFSSLQKALIDSAFQLLKNGGCLVYSTCTFAPEENEEVIDFLLRKYQTAKLEKICLKGFKIAPGIEEFDGKRYVGEVKFCARIWPHLNNSGGFFVAKIRKNDV